jgi:hypothetical protein
MLSRQSGNTILARGAHASRWLTVTRHRPPGVLADRAVAAPTSHAMSNCYRCSRLGAGLQIEGPSSDRTRTGEQVAPLLHQGHAGQQFRMARFVQRRKWREGAERSEQVNSVRFTVVSEALPNYAMQRTGTDKVPGRGRKSPAPVDVHRARVPMRWPAVADGGR